MQAFKAKAVPTDRLIMFDRLLSLAHDPSIPIHWSRPERGQLWPAAAKEDRAKAKKDEWNAKCGQQGEPSAFGSFNFQLVMFPILPLVSPCIPY